VPEEGQKIQECPLSWEEFISCFAKKKLIVAWVDFGSMDANMA
jgi:hypothetical protein